VSQIVCASLDPIGRDPAGTGMLEAMVLHNVSWGRGTTLNVCFFNGDPFWHTLVKRHAKTWLEFANLKFRFVAPSEYRDSHIRVSFASPFTRPRAFSSLVGNQATQVDVRQPTMHLGFTDDMRGDERECRRLILHEFGHSLGLVHEHQNPDAGITFKIPAVYDYFSRVHGWDRAMVNHNVVAKVNRNDVKNGSRFDPQSIMLYAFPPEIAEPATRENFEISALDKKVIGEVYPFEAPARTDPGDPGAEAPAGMPIEVDGPPTTATLPLPGFELVFRFHAKAAARYLVETLGDQAWVMSLFDTDDIVAPVATDAAGAGDGLNARIEAALKRGDYLVKVRHRIPTGRGALGVQVRRLG